MHSEKTRLVILDPRQLIVGMFERIFREEKWVQEILPASNTDEAIENAFRPLPDETEPRRQGEGGRSVFFLIGGFPYLKTISILSRISACCPTARIVLLDDFPRYGCSVVVRQLPVHGYLSLYDSPTFCRRCVQDILQGEAVLSPLASEYLEIDENRHTVVCPRKLRARRLHMLPEDEWLCFQYLVGNKDLSELSKRLNLADRSIRNLKYEMMRSLGINKFHDVLRKAHDWGLFDQ